MSTAIEAIGFDMERLARLLLYSILIGAALGALFDVLRVLRIFLSPSESAPAKRLSEACLTAVVFLEDLAFFLVTAFVVVVFLFHTNHGTARGFLLAGAAGGFFLYLNSFGRLTMLCAKAICRIIRWILSLFIGKIVRPVLRGVGKCAVYIYSKTVGRAFFRFILIWKRRRSERLARELTRFCVHIGKNKKLL